MRDGDPEPDVALETQTVAGIAIGVVILGGVAGLFVIDFGAGTPEPVEFDRTASVGLTLEDEMRLEDTDEAIELPRAQVFYSQYPYVVGYYGVESFVAAQRETTHERQFGFPTAAYVTDYADRGVELTDEGYPTTRLPPGWVAIDEAFYVVESDARTPTGPAAVSFGTEKAAADFAAEHGGEVIDWETMLDRPVDIDDAEGVRERIASDRSSADETVATRLEAAERPVGVVVGEDEPTLQGAVDAAEPDTTVLVPEGVYEGPIELDRPVTLRGDGEVRIDGGGNGTVLTVTADRAAVVGVTVSGTGGETPGPTVTDDHAHGSVGGGGHDHGETDDEDDSWDAAIDDDYAGGDAAIAIDTATEVLVADSRLETDAAGIIIRDSPGFVVRNATVLGSENYREGHMGVAAMRSSGIVEGSTFADGLDGVYTHRADGIVVRDNVLRDNRMGVHLMFTSDALLADNDISGQETTGIYVMTGPERNGIVGNEITDTRTAIRFGGADTYVADNVLIENHLGLRIDGVASIVERNVIVDNRNGIEAWGVLPTNRVTHNDFVGNERHVAVSSGRLRIWTHDGEGNYWEGAVGETDGTVVERPYTPTDAVDSRLHRVDGAATLAQAPALDALAGFEGAVPGMRADGIIDTAPLCAPVNDEWFEQHGRTDTEPICSSEDGRQTEPHA